MLYLITLFRETILKIKEEKEKLKSEANKVSNKFGTIENLKELLAINEDFDKEDENTDHYEKTIRDLLNKQNGQKSVAMYLYVEHQKIEKLKERINILEKEKKEAQVPSYSSYNPQHLKGNYYSHLLPDVKSQNINHTNNTINSSRNNISTNNTIPKRKLNDLDLDKDDKDIQEKNNKKQKLSIKDEVNDLNLIQETNEEVKSIILNNVNPFENMKINKDTLKSVPNLALKSDNPFNKPMMNPGLFVKKNNSILNNMKQTTLVSANNSNNTINIFNKK